MKNLLLVVVLSVAAFATVANATCAGDCENGGTKAQGNCTCASGYEGNCCQSDIDECVQGSHGCPANSVCKNTNGSFVCNCNPCYLKNPVTQLCEVNQGASCNDNNLCTHTDECQADASCAGTAYSCYWCEACNGTGGCDISDTSKYEYQYPIYSIYGNETVKACVEKNFCNDKNTQNAIPNGEQFLVPESETEQPGAGNCNQIYVCQKHENPVYFITYIRYAAMGDRWKSPGLNAAGNVTVFAQDHEANINCNPRTVNPCDGRPEGNYKDPTNCGKYIACTENGDAHHMFCPAGLHFDEARDTCDWPKDLSPPCTIP